MSTPTAQLTAEEQKALTSIGSSEVNLAGIRGLDQTEAGEEALAIEELADPFLIVSAYCQGTTWKNGDEERAGFVTHMLIMADPKQPQKLRECYSNSETIATKIQQLIDKDNLGPENPVVVKFATQETRSGFKVNKLIAPTKQELQNFIGALSKSS